ncbi:MAG TPA: hypothetical protein VH000_10400 [Rhizomicrobium sp.]|jgi:predicted transcriptional regulator|nr:hypothetical protein [Rhizomicrobium sp.]HEX4534631.1 hypothetical protein [Rhizomicrobium sp.]
MNKSLTEVLERAHSWPEEARDELEHLALEIEAELSQGAYRATPEEWKGINRGLRDAAKGNFASAAEVEATFAKYRG